MKVSIKDPSALLAAAISFVFLLCVVVANKYVPKAIMRYYVSSFEPAVISDGEQFEILLRNGTYKMIQNESWGTKPYANKESLCDMLCHPPVPSVGEYGEYAILMHYAFLYAEQACDTDMQILVRAKFDKFYRDENVIPIVRTDQIAYGNIALDLYRWTRDDYYLSFAEGLFNRLDSIRQANGIILYRDNSAIQKVDALGVICPFLVHYGETTNNKRSIELSAEMVADYIRWGTDEVTGIPVKSYTAAEPHIKCNRANWGRGIGWFLEGAEAVLEADTLSYPIVSEMLYSSNLYKRVRLLIQTLYADSDCLYQQYYGEGDVPDMSATIPILLFVHSKMSDMTKTELANLISPYFDKDGIMRYGSPSFSRPEKAVNVTITNLRVQGIALYLCSICK